MKDINKALKDMDKELSTAQEVILQKWADKLDMDIDDLVDKFAQYRMRVIKEIVEEEKEQKPKPTKVQEVKYKS